MLGLTSSLASASYHEQRYSILLDGTDDYITANGWQPSVTNGYESEGSVSVWVKKIASSSNAVIFSTGVGTSSANQISLYYDLSNTKLIFSYTGNNTTNVEAFYTISESDFIALGWTHIVVTWNEASGERGKLWVNGVQRGVTSTDFTAFVGIPNRFHIGTASHTVTQLWKGYISEFALFTAVQLGEAEIISIYNQKNPSALTNAFGNYGSYSQLTAYWQMDDGSGTTAKDSKRLYAADGTLVNMTGDASSWKTDTPDD